jgi:hypothetical protein
VWLPWRTLVECVVPHVLGGDSDSVPEPTDNSFARKQELFVAVQDRRAGARLEPRERSRETLLEYFRGSDQGAIRRAVLDF